MNMQVHFNLWRQHLAWQTAQGSFTYDQWEQLIRRRAWALQEWGVQAGECWAIGGAPAFETFTWILAGLWQGAILFPLPDRLPPSIQDSMLAQIPLRGILPIDSMDLDSKCPHREGSMTWDTRRPSVGIFTSGSTGVPKAIVHSWESLSRSALTTNQFYQFGPDEKWLLSLDLAHIGGLQIAVRCFWAAGICVHLAEPKNMDVALEQISPQFLSLVPTQLYRLMENPQALAVLKQCKAIVLGGAAASMSLLEKAKFHGLAISVSYGSSETSAQCTALRPGELPQHSGDVGDVLPGWDIQSEGEVLRLRGPAAMLGFYQQGQWHPGQDSAGWMTLPDRILCRGRRLTVLGRADGIFQVAGENVAPQDILNPLEPLRAQADFLVLPWPDAEYGQLPVLLVRSPQNPDVTRILELWQGSLSGLQRPRRIYWHASDEIAKPSRSFYENALKKGELSLIWRQDLGRI